MQTPLARATDPLTSHDAAAQAEIFGGTHRMRILSALQAMGPSTPHELQTRTDLTVVQIDRRLHELQKAGLADVVTWPDGKDVVRNGARVWRAVETLQ